MKKIRMGLIGGGFIGRAHATAYKNIMPIFGPEIRPELVVMADANETVAKRIQESHQFARCTTDWREVVDAPDVDAVCVSTPNNSHCEISIAAAKKGKHILCEKPLGMDGDEAMAAAKAVAETGVVAAVGFNMVQAPVTQYAKELYTSGRLGDLVSFRGVYDTDGLSYDGVKHEWRMLKKNSTIGALGDLGAHTLSVSQFILGDIAEVCGMTKIVFPERPDPKDADRMLPVENEDTGQCMFTYKNGGMGQLVSSRVGVGRKQNCTYEIQGTKGTVYWTLERMNELKFYTHGRDRREEGFKLIQTSPGHGEYGHFFGGQAIEIGYEDLKIIENYKFLCNIAEGSRPEIDFVFGAKINCVLDALLESDAGRKWVKVRSVN